MPIPSPEVNEKEKDFISRCMADEVMNKEYPDNEKRAGICYTSWREKKKDSTDFEPPESGNAPESVKAILNAAYSSCRLGWTKIHPDDKENQTNKTSCSKQAWAAVKNAGWNKVNGEWEKSAANKKDSEDTIKFDKTELKAIRTGEGFLKARISIARPGVFKYITDYITTNEAKLPEDLFSAFTMESIKNGIPITDNHPEENGEYVLLDSGNYQKFIKGHISNPRIENNEIVGDVLIYDAELIQKILNKEQNEVSIGALSFDVAENGFYGKEQYNVKQTKLRINHAAIVKHGRAGESIRIHLDRRQDMPKKWTVEGGDASNLLTYRLFDNSEDIQVSPDIHTELMKIKNDNKDKGIKFDTLNKEKVELEKQIEKIKIDKKDDKEVEKFKIDLETANDSVKEWKRKFDELQKSIPETVEKESAEKVKLIAFAQSVDSKMKVDGLSNKEIKLQIIAKGLPFKEGMKIDSMSDEAVEARYDAACELLRVRANEIPNNKIQNKIKVDADTIAIKREKLQTVYEDSQKKEAK